MVAWNSIVNDRDGRREKFAGMSKGVDRSLVRENSREEYLYVMLRSLNFILRAIEVCERFLSTSGLNRTAFWFCC